MNKQKLCMLVLHVFFSFPFPPSIIEKNLTFLSWHVVINCTMLCRLYSCMDKNGRGGQAGNSPGYC